LKKHPKKLPPSKKYPGALIVVEGIDGSGKARNCIVKRWLEISGYRLHFTEWNSSPLVKSATRRGKQRRLLTPTTFSLLHAADFADAASAKSCRCFIADTLCLRTATSTRHLRVTWRGTARPAGCASLPVCAGSGHHVLFPRPARRGREENYERQAKAEILRSRHGPEPLAGPRGKVSEYFRAASWPSMTKWWNPD